MTKQVIVVKLDGLFYGIEVSLVQEVVYSFGERALPEAPNFIQGLAYIRERLLPIIRTKRLFNSPFFDLYNNKKILVLNFGNENQIGMIIDEVVGIEMYEDTEIKNISSIYNVATSQDIIGFIEKRGREIVLLNISSFFFTKKGEFRYKRYVNKQQTKEKEITKEELVKVEDMVKKAGFIFNELTISPIVRFVKRIASLEGKTVSEVLVQQPDLFNRNKHMVLHKKREYLFDNMADMYMLTEYFELLLSTTKNAEIRILVVGEQDAYNAVSMALILESLKKRSVSIKIVNMMESELEPGINYFDFPLDALKKISKELHSKYFVLKEESEDIYKLLPNISSNIEMISFNLGSLVAKEQEFDLIYANNFLIAQNQNRLKINLDLLESLISKNGVLTLGLFEDVEEFVRALKKYYIKSRLIFIKE